MFGKVNELFDVRKLEIPAEYLDVAVTDGDVARRHEYLATAYGTQVPAERAAEGDCAVCACREGSLAGRTVLLYPGKGFEAAAQAERDVLLRGPGECFVTRIGGGTCTLEVLRVTRTVQAAVDDALIATLGVEGVSTLAEYDSWYRAGERAERIQVKAKALGTYLLRELAERSDISLEEPDVEEQIEAEYVRHRENGGEGGREEVRQMVLERLRQNSVVVELCRRQGIQVTAEDVQPYVDQMSEMMALMGEEPPSREALTEQYIEGEYYTRGFDLLLREARERLEGTQ